MKSPANVVLIIGREIKLGVPARVEDVLEKEGLTIRWLDEGTIPDTLPARLDGNELPSAVLLMEDLANPLAVARRVHALAPSVQIVFVAGEERAAQLRTELVGVPRIGRH